MGIGFVTTATRRAVFLDRDGVLNHAILKSRRPHPPLSADAMELIADAPAALERLKALGFLLIVVTNQPDIARGDLTPEDVRAIHDVLAARLPLDDFYVCPHDNADGCECRKPLPGLIFQAAARHAIDLTRSYLIGDRWRDVAAGKNAGVRTIFIDYAYDEPRPEPEADATVANITEAARWIGAQEQVM